MRQALPIGPADVPPPRRPGGVPWRRLWKYPASVAAVALLALFCFSSELLTCTGCMSRARERVLSLALPHEDRPRVVLWRFLDVSPSATLTDVLDGGHAHVWAGCGGWSAGLRIPHSWCGWGGQNVNPFTRACENDADFRDELLARRDDGRLAGEDLTRMLALPGRIDVPGHVSARDQELLEQAWATLDEYYGPAEERRPWFQAHRLRSSPSAPGDEPPAGCPGPQTRR